VITDHSVTENEESKSCPATFTIILKVPGVEVAPISHEIEQVPSDDVVQAKLCTVNPEA
jgi:hypothetical protein